MISLLSSLISLKLPEEERYSVIDSQGPFEIRFYRRLACAKVFVPGDLSFAYSQGRKHLEDYLGGSNFRVEKITATPFYFLQKCFNGWEAGVVLNTFEDVPRPINRLVKLTEFFPGKVGVLKFNGDISEEFVEKRKTDLVKWLNFRNYKSISDIRLFYKDSLVTFPFERTKEVHINLI